MFFFTRNYVGAGDGIKMLRVGTDAQDGTSAQDALTASYCGSQELDEKLLQERIDRKTSEEELQDRIKVLEGRADAKGK
jgi:hypothetical protein